MNAMEEYAPDSWTPADVRTSLRLIDHDVTQGGVPITVFENLHDAFFCSTQCLRDFFNQVITDFENGTT
jgi:hypothetical protein